MLGAEMEMFFVGDGERKGSGCCLNTGWRTAWADSVLIEASIAFGNSPITINAIVGAVPIVLSIAVSPLSFRLP
jgi:hypothetical protein